jgi:hypothetical protein
MDYDSSHTKLTEEAMRVLTIGGLVTDIVFLALWQPVLGDDAWYNQLRSDYKYQKRSLDRQRDHREGCLESWFESAKEDLELKRREALREARGNARHDIVTQFQAKTKSLEDTRDRGETALSVWYERNRDLLRDRYDAAKDWLTYREQQDLNRSESPGYLAPVQIPRQHHRVRPQTRANALGYSVGQRRPMREVEPGASWIFRVP